jgi:RNA recognition motif-containing protein
MLLKRPAKLLITLSPIPILASESKVTQSVPALHVENLNVDVTEAMLRNVFGRVGGVTAVMINRDPVTRKSNGIGHV